ncbi:MAG: HU family DNA-binding protein [Spirochaetes bacterium]|nr:HU family DNA-binding protein [Spirochaetota bacterium]
MKRTRKDLIQALVEAGIQSVDAKRFVDEFINIIQGSIMHGEEIRLKNFGKFIIVTKKGNEFINPKTKLKTLIPDHKKIRFIPSENLKKLINQYEK